MKQKELLRAREKLVREFPSPAEIVRGSLLERRVRHRRGCRTCSQGEGHPVWVLTVTYKGGRNKQLSIRPEKRAQAERWLRNYQELKARLEAICEINHELLRAEG
jgi:hypothetical protein